MKITAALILLTLMTLLGVSAPQDGASGRTGPPWSDYLAFQSVEGVRFRWRVDPEFRREGQNFFQFEFENQAEHPVHFNYIIETETGERVVGSISLVSKKSRLSGWYFEGSSVVDIEVVDPVLLRKMFEGGER